MESSKLLYLNENTSPNVPASDSSLVAKLDNRIAISENFNGNELVKTNVGNRSWLPAAYLEAVSDDSPDERKRTSNQGRDGSSVRTPKKDPTWRPVDESSEESSSDESDSEYTIKRGCKKPKKDTPRPAPSNGLITTTNFDGGEGHTHTPTGTSNDARKYRPLPCEGGNQKSTERTPPKKPSDPEDSSAVFVYNPIGTVGGNSYQKTPLDSSREKSLTQTPADPNPKTPPKNPEDLFAVVYKPIGTGEGNSSPRTPLYPARENGLTQTPTDSSNDEGLFRRPAPYGGGNQKSTPKTPPKKAKDSFAVPVNNSYGIALQSGFNTSPDAMKLKHVVNELTVVRRNYREIEGRFRILSKQAKLFKCFDFRRNKFCRVKSECSTPIVCKTRKDMKKQLIELNKRMTILKKKEKALAAGRSVGKDAAPDMPSVSPQIFYMPSTSPAVTSSLREMAHKVNPSLVRWCQREDWWPRLRIVATDFFLETDIVNLAVNGNVMKTNNNKRYETD